LFLLCSSAQSPPRENRDRSEDCAAVLEEDSEWEEKTDSGGAPTAAEKILSTFGNCWNERPCYIRPSTL